MKLAKQLGAALEVLGGARPLPDALAGRTSVAVLRGLSWVAFLLLAWAFSGRATKFIYIDF